MGVSENGKKLVTIISGYVAVKSLINLIIGFSAGNLVTLIIMIALCYVMMKGQKYMNYVVAAVLGVVALFHLKNNIAGKQFLYLFEGILDIASAVVLIINKDIKAYLTTNKLF